jgi:serine/threonine protein kinase
MLQMKYSLLEKISDGTFGQVYKGQSKLTKEYVAIKIESKNMNNINTLKNEAKIYQYLNSPDFPNLKWYGSDENNTYLVINYYKYSLKDVMNKYGNNKKMSLQLTINIGTQIIKLLQYLHSKQLIHRDIKPENLLVDTDKNSFKIYLIDYSFCKRYIKDDGKHIPQKNINSLIGNLIFMSINVHNYIEPSRRDDIESVIYLLVCLYYGSLQWIKETDPIKILLLKEELIHNHSFLFYEVLLYIRSLEFSDNPDYNYLIYLLNNIIK